MMIKYESKKHPGEFLTTDGVVSEKFKTVIVNFADGTNQSMNIATLKRWWKKIGEVEEIPAGETKEEAPAEEAKPVKKTGKHTSCAKAARAEAKAKKEKAPAPDLTEKTEELKAIYENLRANRFKVAARDLPEIALRVSKKVKGHFAKAVDLEDEKMIMILGPDSTEADIAHNLIHAYCLSEGIKDTCQGGRYHNDAYRAAAGVFGLEMEYTTANGWREIKNGL